MASSSIDNDSPRVRLEDLNNEWIKSTVNRGIRHGIVLIELSGTHNVMTTAHSWLDMLVNNSPQDDLRIIDLDLKQYAKSFDKDPVRLIDDMTCMVSTNTDNYTEISSNYRLQDRPGKIVAAIKNCDEETRLYQRPDWLVAYDEVREAHLKTINGEYSTDTKLVYSLRNIDTFSELGFGHLSMSLMRLWVGRPNSVALTTRTDNRVSHHIYPDFRYSFNFFHVVND